MHDSHPRTTKKCVGAHQIIMGLDDPFPLGEVEGVGTSYPGRARLCYKIRHNNKSGGKDIWHKNAGLVGNKIECFDKNLYNRYKNMSDQIKHECGIALRDFKPLEYYKKMAHPFMG